MNRAFRVTIQGVGDVIVMADGAQEARARARKAAMENGHTVRHADMSVVRAPDHDDTPREVPDSVPVGYRQFMVRPCSS